MRRGKFAPWMQGNEYSCCNFYYNALGSHEFLAGSTLRGKESAFPSGLTQGKEHFMNDKDPGSRSRNLQLIETRLILFSSI